MKNKSHSHSDSAATRNPPSALHTTGLLLIRRILFLTVILLSKGQVAAGTSLYYVRHDFNVVPTAGGGSAPVAFGVGSGFAYARATHGATVTDGPRGFAGFLPGTLNTSASATIGSSHADSSATVTLGYSLGGIRGSTVAQGIATASAPGASAFASSRANAFAVVGAYDWRQGRVNWTGVIGSSVGGSASAQGPVRPRDPFTYTYRDGNGSTVSTGTLADITLDLNVSTDALGQEFSHYDPFTYRWNSTAGFITDSPNFILNILMDDPFLDPVDRGLLRLVVKDNIVTEAIKTGSYSSIALPGLGTNVMGSGVNIPDLGLSFDIGFDMSSMITGPGGNLDFGIDFGGSAAAIPEPKSTSGLLAAIVMLAFVRRRHR